MNIIFNIDSHKDFKELQKYFFSKGYKWIMSGCKLIEIDDDKLKNFNVVIHKHLRKIMTHDPKFYVSEYKNYKTCSWKVFIRKEKIKKHK